MKKSLALVALAFGISALSACQNTGGAYVYAWYDAYGNPCGSMPGPGCDYYSNGMKINLWEDPYWALAPSPYGDPNDPYGDNGYPWMSPDGIIYDQWGNALNATPEDDSRDLIGDVAAQERAMIVRAGKTLAAKYALSEATSLSIARTLNDWATLTRGSKRARTAQDVADFSVRLYGVSADRAQAALDAARAGDRSGLESVNTAVATYWGTTPETSKRILKTWYRNELAEYGLAE